MSRSRNPGTQLHQQLGYQQVDLTQSQQNLRAFLSNAGNRQEINRFLSPDLMQVLDDTLTGPVNANTGPTLDYIYQQFIKGLEHVTGEPLDTRGTMQEEWLNSFAHRMRTITAPSQAASHPGSSSSTPTMAERYETMRHLLGEQFNNIHDIRNIVNQLPSQQRREIFAHMNYAYEEDGISRVVMFGPNGMPFAEAIHSEDKLHFNFYSPNGLRETPTTDMYERAIEQMSYTLPNFVYSTPAAQEAMQLKDIQDKAGVTQAVNATAYNIRQELKRRRHLLMQQQAAAEEQFQAALMPALLASLRNPQNMARSAVQFDTLIGSANQIRGFSLQLLSKIFKALSARSRTIIGEFLGLLFVLIRELFKKRGLFAMINVKIPTYMKFFNKASATERKTLQNAWMKVLGKVVVNGKLANAPKRRPPLTIDERRVFDKYWRKYYNSLSFEEQKEADKEMRDYNLQTEEDFHTCYNALQPKVAGRHNLDNKHHQKINDVGNHNRKVKRLNRAALARQAAEREEEDYYRHLDQFSEEDHNYSRAHFYDHTTNKLSSNYTQTESDLLFDLNEQQLDELYGTDPDSSISATLNAEQSRKEFGNDGSRSTRSHTQMLRKHLAKGTNKEIAENIVDDYLQDLAKSTGLKFNADAKDALLNMVYQTKDGSTTTLAEQIANSSFQNLNPRELENQIKQLHHHVDTALDAHFSARADKRHATNKAVANTLYKNLNILPGSEEQYTTDLINFLATSTSSEPITVPETLAIFSEAKRRVILDNTFIAHPDPNDPKQIHYMSIQEYINCAMEEGEYSEQLLFNVLEAIDNQAATGSYANLINYIKQNNHQLRADKKAVEQDKRDTTQKLNALDKALAKASLDGTNPLTIDAIKKDIKHLEAELIKHDDKITNIEEAIAKNKAKIDNLSKDQKINFVQKLFAVDMANANKGAAYQTTRLPFQFQGAKTSKLMEYMRLNAKSDNQSKPFDAFFKLPINHPHARTIGELIDKLSKGKGLTDKNIDLILKLANDSAANKLSSTYDARVASARLKINKRFDRKLQFTQSAYWAAAADDGDTGFKAVVRFSGAVAKEEAEDIQTAADALARDLTAKLKNKSTIIDEKTLNARIANLPANASLKHIIDTLDLHDQIPDTVDATISAEDIAEAIQARYPGLFNPNSKSFHQSIVDSPLQTKTAKKVSFLDDFLESLDLENELDHLAGEGQFDAPASSSSNAKAVAAGLAKGITGAPTAPSTSAKTTAKSTAAALAGSKGKATANDDEQNDADTADVTGSNVTVQSVQKEALALSERLAALPSTQRQIVIQQSKAFAESNPDTTYAERANFAKETMAKVAQAAADYTQNQSAYRQKRAYKNPFLQAQARQAIYKLYMVNQFDHFAAGEDFYKAVLDAVRNQDAQTQAFKDFSDDDLLDMIGEQATKMDRQAAVLQIEAVMESIDEAFYEKAQRGQMPMIEKHHTYFKGHQITDAMRKRAHFRKLVESVVKGQTITEAQVVRFLYPGIKTPNHAQEVYAKALTMALNDMDANQFVSMPANAHKIANPYMALSRHAANGKAVVMHQNKLAQHNKSTPGSFGNSGQLPPGQMPSKVDPAMREHLEELMRNSPGNRSNGA